jgi:hypothetical protein
MRMLIVRNILRKSTIFYGISGLLIGLAIFIYSIFNSSSTFYIGSTEIHGIWSGLIAIVFIPLVMGFVGFVHGIFIWLPLVHIFKKITNGAGKKKQLK